MGAAGGLGAGRTEGERAPAGVGERLGPGWRRLEDPGLDAPKASVHLPGWESGSGWTGVGASVHLPEVGWGFLK